MSCWLQVHVSWSVWSPQAAFQLPDVCENPRGGWQTQHGWVQLLPSRRTSKSFIQFKSPAGPYFSDTWHLITSNSLLSSGIIYLFFLISLRETWLSLINIYAVWSSADKQVASNWWVFFQVLDKKDRKHNSCAKWLPDSSWDNVLELSKLSEFRDIVASFEKYPQDWNHWFTRSDPENAPLPGQYAVGGRWGTQQWNKSILY